MAGSELKFKLQWMIFRLWPDRRRLGEEENSFHRTVEESDFWCSCTIFEGSPHLTIPSWLPMFATLFYRKCRKYMRFNISLCILGGDFWQPFWRFWRWPKNIRTVECVNKRPRFSLTKTVFFASNFEAILECNPIFGDPRQETFMAACLKPNLRMAESTLR